ncbi:type VII secretion integral membrane protein EccD [Actinoplanes derwentensis]|uniref:type VII secretion integral membrane protein EccD n=1 Tax=Actinoplanes derwentensis TaxID=113562 RepID=UPI001E567EA2|nr:type VII secretion integral membrane protein EccD [Actinoplanes derwentensis]
MVAPAGRADVAVPSDLPLAQLLPVLLARGAAGDVTTGRWVLQRLGEEPLADEQTPTDLGLHDGELLHLRPVEAVLPPIDFDDIVDGVSTAVEGLTGRWQPANSRRLLIAAGAVVLCAGLAAASTGAGSAPRVITAAVLAIALAIVAGACSRALGDRAAATVTGTAAVAFAGLTGSLLPGLSGAAPAASGGGLLAGSALAAATAVLVSITVGASTPFFAGVLAVTSAGALAGLLTVWPGLTAAAAAADVVATAFLASVLIPNLVTRMVRLRVPALPSGREDLSRDIEPHPEPQIVAQAAAADRYLTAFAGAVALICVGGFIPLGMTGGFLNWALLGVVSGGLLLRARSLAATWQRLSAAVPGLVGAAILVMGTAAHSGQAVRSLLAAAAVTTGVLLVTGSSRRTDRVSPYWGRLADIAETLTAIAVIPLAIAIMGGYEFVRGLAG